MTFAAAEEPEPENKTVASGIIYTPSTPPLNPDRPKLTRSIPYPPTTSTRPVWPSTDPDEDFEAKEKAEREAELVVLPSKRPKKVLVAFFDDEDEDVNGEPFWAAFLEPEDMDLFLSPKDSRDAHMALRLALRKRFSQ